MEDRAGVKVVTAKVPLAEMFAYSTTLRGMNSGPRPTTPCSSRTTKKPPGNVAEEIVAKVKGAK